MAASKSAMREKVVQFRGPLADEVGEHLAFFLAWKVGAGRRSGEIELGSVAGVLGHDLNNPGGFVCFRPPALPARRIPSNPIAASCLARTAGAAHRRGLDC